MPEVHHSIETTWNIGPERQLTSPDYNKETLLSLRTACLRQAQNYHGRFQDEFNSCMDVFQSYENYLRQYYATSLEHQSFSSATERDDFIKNAAIKEGLAINDDLFTVQDMLQEMNSSLDRENKDSKSVEELCRQSGATYAKSDKVFVPAFGHNPIKTGSGEGFEFASYRDKAKELLVFLRQNEIFGENILVTEGDLEKSQIRKYPYLVIEIPAIKKQILICNQMEEAVFISHKWLGASIFEEANKQELQREHGLTRVTYDRNGKWLETIKALLLSGPSEKQNTVSSVTKNGDETQEKKPRSKINLKDFATLRTELLERFPKASDFLRFVEAGKDIGSGTPKISQTDLSALLSDPSPTAA